MIGAPGGPAKFGGTEGRLAETFAVPLVLASALLLNLPLGAWRAGCRRFSPAWFLAIHASIPPVLGLRLWLDVGWGWVPAVIAAALAGQLIGGRFRSCRASAPTR